MRILIKNGHVIDPRNHRNDKFDIFIEDGNISQIGLPGEIDETEAKEIIDAEGKFVFPGFIDAHCHLREPGFEYKETIETGTKSAAKGGFTSVACMPNTSPAIDNASVVEYILQKAKTEGYVNVFPIGAISKGLQGKELANIGELKFAGVVGISDDGRPVMSASLMKKALQYSSMFDLVVISHCEDLDLVEDGVMNEGLQATSVGLKGIPAAAEDTMVAREIVLSEYLNIPVHIAHVSTKTSVALIRDAKKRGVKVTCETCPHYFSLTEDAIGEYDTFAKVNPPLRTEEDRRAIIEGLHDGTIDVIATDHAPHHMDEKRVEFGYAANGIVGFETAVPLVLTYLVKPGHITLEQMTERMCENPARILGLNKGSLDVGKSADITIVDPDASYVVDTALFQSKGKNSPFQGYELNGVVCHTIVNGELVVHNGELCF